MAQQPTDTSPITFIVPGTRAVSRSGAPVPEQHSDAARGTVKDAARLQARRAGGEVLRMTAVPGEDVVVLRLAEGPALVLHPATARDLLLGQQAQAKRSSGGSTTAPGEVEVPAQLRWRGLEQAAPTRSGGFLGDVLLSGIEIVSGLFKDPAADFVAGAVVAKVDGQVDAGVYRLRRDSLPPLKGSGWKVDRVPSAGDAPICVFIHGTFVETVSTFGKLWALHPQRVHDIFDRYAEQVYALDHPTLGASPIDNALLLAEALPAGARLHLITHSRGGLVAEVLARVAGEFAAGRGIGAADAAYFEGQEHSRHRQALEKLAAVVKAKRIRVERVLRVACPARGTLLASRRLDAYLSVLKWTLELSGLPVVPALLDFLTEVARRRADPTAIPGLAAMIPDTPLVNWLNEAEEPIPGELRVLAGDLEGDSLGSWLKTLLADAFYWSDNDIVVQTRSMYGGTPRDADKPKSGASFFLDQGGKSTHFNYFSADRSVRAITAGLLEESPEGWRPIGPLSWAGQDSGGLRAARRGGNDSATAAERPAVFVIPGILGSHLKDGDKRIWLSLRLLGGLKRLAYVPGTRPDTDTVQPDGAIGMVYDDLMEHLAATHEVIEFSFDWRRPIEEEAVRLAERVEAELDRRSASGQPVRICAHSMGGVLARTMQIERPKVFERLMKHEGARLLMLGTPNGGSWAPMQVLSGDDSFGNTLAAFGSPLRDRAARQLMASMPGFLQLQADLLDTRLGLAKSETWQQLASDDLKRVQEANWWHRSAGAAGDAAYEWGVPPKEVLQKAVALRQALDAQRDGGALARFAAKTLLVVGEAEFTPDGYEWGNDGFAYLNAGGGLVGGDGRVPLQSALLPGVRTWTLDAEHGSLPDVKKAFEAYTELLVKGDTDKLPRLDPALAAGAAGASRGAGAAAVAKPRVKSRPSRARPNPRPASAERQVFAAPRSGAAGGGDGGSPRAPALKVQLLNSNLGFVRSTLMVGHSRSLNLTGSEAVVNRLIGNAMRDSLDAGLYPDAIGSHQLFINTRVDPDNPWSLPQPQRVVVVGLGEEGKLTETALAETVRQGTIAWVQRVAQSADGTGVTVELSATLMGSGGVGMTPAGAARAIALGVHQANERLATVARANWPRVAQLTLVELYLERASDAWNGLQVLAESAPGLFDVAPVIDSGVGPLRRQVDSGYRGTGYDFISATSPQAGTIAFALDTRRARTEVRAQSTQFTLIQELVKRAATEANRDPRLGRTLLQLLVPPEVEPFLGGSERMLLEVDEATAPIPWELLDTSPGPSGTSGTQGKPRDDERPWAIRTALLRKLRTDTFRQQVQDAQPDDAVLVIGEPKIDNTQYLPLPGARAEAEAVAAAFSGTGGVGAARVNALVADDDATAVINALFERRYRIVHVAGHGEPVERDPKTGQVLKTGGVVLSDHTFLGPNEIRAMRTVPELVFVNCCHLAKREASAVLAPRAINRAEFAAGVADSLIEIGVRCVVAAGWAVDDIPAKVFAETFYREILKRRPFVSAVAAAREAAWNTDRHSNTWAAYQAYGDPNWVYRKTADEEAAAPPPPPREEFQTVASPLGLAIALEELAVRVGWMGADPTEQLEKVRHLEARFGALWGSMGAIAEAFGTAYKEAGDLSAAIGWYERALAATDGSATLKTQEQLHNLRARHGWWLAQHTKPGARSNEALDRARAEVQDATERLAVMAVLQANTERLALVGSAYKRLGLLERHAGRPAAAREAFANAAAAYGDAECMAAQQMDPELFYPALNRMALAYVAHFGAKGFGGFGNEELATVRRSLLAAVQQQPDFWSHVGLIELDLLAALATRGLGAARADLEARFAALHDRVRSPRMWASVADNAALTLATHEERAGRNEAAAARGLLKVLEAYAQGG
jgi:tetratricopeptide (TPR) repeat protein